MDRVAKVERCANCEKSIGRLEPAFVWQGEVVCGECHGRLSATATEHEHLYYRNGAIALSDRRLTIGGKTFPLANLTSVHTGTVIVTSPDRERAATLRACGWVGVAMCGLLLLWFAAWVAMYGLGRDFGPYALLVLLVFVAIPMIGFFQAARAAWNRGWPDYPSYRLIVTANSGEKHAIAFVNKRVAVMFRAVLSELMGAAASGARPASPVIEFEVHRVESWAVPTVPVFVLGWDA